ncbi:hypothetical protein IB286_05090 [Spongiibacter sp. KMU-158]|uniref:DUF3805 domain-containing protein n=1 Tax=Spongiibacter pelagi TaxID=2760804 RepID=A0A927GVS0_9GAMM|nr:hypothetical protein [Spongiibacter pelagi]MBD2858378.1 hypothetical protein [Spongiibacter pelagi]
MREIESDWWFIALPEQWHSEQDEDSILIFDEDELGCISLSTLQAESGQKADEAALLGLLKQLDYKASEGVPVEVGEGWRGLEYETEEEGDYIREWFLYGHGLLLLISYSCAEEDRDMDRAAVDEILSTLRPIAL